jgi:hypothetical protein
MSASFDRSDRPVLMIDVGENSPQAGRPSAVVAARAVRPAVNTGPAGLDDLYRPVS